MLMRGIHRKYVGYILFFTFILFVSYTWIHLTNNVDDVVSYGLYQEQRDLAELEVLLEQNKFWLFHGDAEEAKKKILESVISGLHDDDFEKDAKVHYYVHVARVKNKMVGFVTFFGSEEKKIGRVHLLAVDCAYRRLGIGEQLIEFAIEHFKRLGFNKIFLYTRPENIRAKKLYKKLCFYELERDENRLFDKNPGDVLMLDLK